MVNEENDCHSHIFMPPTLEKLKGHIAFASSVRPSRTHEWTLVAYFKIPKFLKLVEDDE